MRMDCSGGWRLQCQSPRCAHQLIPHILVTRPLSRGFFCSWCTQIPFLCVQILPTAAGLLLGVVNMWGSAAGALAPYIMARLTEYPEGTSREQWEQLGREPTPFWLSEVKQGWATVFILACSVDILGIALYCTFSSGERLTWSPQTTSLAAQKREAERPAGE